MKRFLKDEGASATIEFVIWFPMFITLFLSCVELGLITVRHTMLERGLDMAVRDVRLGTGRTPENHDELKDLICGYAGFIPDCRATLRLEMRPIEMRAFAALSPNADCVDLSQPVLPLREFATGLSNQVMVLRACVKFDPVFPTTGLGRALATDGSGQAALIATSAFVQEPST